MNAFPQGFFDRADTDDVGFYRPTRLVTHIDDTAIAAVGDLYDELGLADGEVLDLMASWVSHFHRQPRALALLGMNAEELQANPMGTSWTVRDLNDDPGLPYADGSFDAVTCCVSIDYLIRPVEVLTEVARVLRPGGVVVITYSNRCFPSKAIRGWLATTDEDHATIVGAYLEAAGSFTTPETQVRVPPGGRSDPLWAVLARKPAGAEL